MRFEVLGPVRGWRDDDELELGSPQQRLTLAALLLAGGRVVGVDQLLDMLWGQEQPRSAMGTLRTYVSRLRAVLGPGVIVSIGDGYQLGARTDVNVFSELVAQARDAAPRQASELLVRALDLWHGEPLAGLPGAYAEGQRVRLGELRLSAQESRIEADLALGRHADTVAELTSFCAEHPARERLRGLLMRALYLSGRQAEAIGVYTDTRRLLAEELGVDPSPDLAELYQRIITADPALGGPAAAPAVRGEAAMNVPRHLPADVADFTGRSHEVDALVAALSQHGSPALPVSNVVGAGGVGKTTLAVHVAHRLAEQYPDGQLFVDLRGAEADPSPPDAVLGSFLRALSGDEPPESLHERSALFRSLLADRRVLVVLDNAADAAQVRPLLPGASGCAVLVTSRSRLAGLGGSRQVDLEVLSPTEAMVLLGKVMGLARVAAEHGPSMDLVAACGFLPLAIRIAGARLAARPQWSVARLCDRLADEHRRLAELRTGNLAVEACFALGYDQLAEGPARVFRLLALPDAADISLPAAVALVGGDAIDVEDACEALVDLSMLESPSPGRYRFHDLVKVFARSREERDDARGEALTRLLDFYTGSVANAYRLRYPGDHLPDRAPTAPPGAGLPFTDREIAVSWVIDEGEALLSCVRQAAVSLDGVLYRAVRLVEMCGNIVDETVAFQRTLDLLVKEAGSRGDRAAEAYAHYVRGSQYSANPHLATQDAMRARELSTAVGDDAVLAASLCQLALLSHSDEEAIRLYSASAEISEALGDRSDVGTLLGNIAMALNRLGRTEEAVEAAERSYLIRTELSGGNTDPAAYYHLGVVLSGAGKHDRALDLLGKALADYRTLRMRDWEGVSQLRIAEVQLRMRLPEEAIASAEAGLADLMAVGDETWQGRTLVVLARALAELGQEGRAHACLVEALELFERLDLPDAEEVRGLLKAVPV